MKRRIDVNNVQVGDPLYERTIGAIRGDYELMTRLWIEAECDMAEEPNKTWTVVTSMGDRGLVPLAWCSSWIDEHGQLACGDNYERPGRGRRNGLYTVAYRFRHATIVDRWPGHATTFLFREPIALHTDDGWRSAGPSGVGVTGHRWWKLVRGPAIVTKSGTVPDGEDG